MTLQPEFSRIVEINENVLNQKLKIVAEQEELAKLAERFSLHSIKFMELEYFISNKDSIKNAYNLNCYLHAEVVNFIIDNTEDTILLNESFDVTLIDEENLTKNADLLKEEDIEIIDLEKPQIDIGEIASQYLSLFVFM